MQAGECSMRASACGLDEHTDSVGPLQVLVVRSDLNMTKGKIAAQCGYAIIATAVTPGGEV